MNIVTPKESAQAREAILRSDALERYVNYVRFASGKLANNHLSMERVPERGPAAEAVFGPMGKIVRRLRPDVLVGIPRGGQNWALLIGNREGVRVAELRVISKENRTFGYASVAARLLVEQATRIVIIEDATSRRTNELGVYRSLPAIGEKAVACATGWARDYAEARLDTGVTLIPIVEEVIPYDLTADHPLYARAVLKEQAQA